MLELVTSLLECLKSKSYSHERSDYFTDIPQTTQMNVLQYINQNKVH